MERTVNLAVIGAGLWGERHLKIYTRDPRARVVAVCDLDAARAACLAGKYSVAHHYSDFRTMLDKHPEIDGVSVVTPDHLHRGPAVACLAAGKHVLVEKPLAGSLDDAKAIVDAAEAAGRKLMVEFNSRWAVPFAHVKQAVQQGEIGTPLHGFARFSNTLSVPTRMLKWAGRSSVLVFVGCLMIDVARWILADEVVRVYAVSRKGFLAGQGVDTPDFFCSVLEFSKGTVVALDNSWVLPNGTPVRADIRFELVGTAGSFHLDLKQHGAVRKYTVDAVDFPEVFAASASMGEDLGSVDRCIRSFIDCLGSGTDPIATGRDGLEVARVTDAIYRSIDTGAPVTLDR